ncbi:hypothetical protein D0T56_12335, partial [Dysgonomonas sp. 520]|nr:hypothetical protein [Dysgonomonas sp. 520]
MKNCAKRRTTFLIHHSSFLIFFLVMTAKDVLKYWFRKGAYPTEEQFSAWLDSYFHKSETIPIDNVEDVKRYLNEKASASVVDDLLKDMVTVDNHMSNKLVHATYVRYADIDNLTGVESKGAYNVEGDYHMFVMVGLYLEENNGEGGTFRLYTIQVMLDNDGIRRRENKAGVWSAWSYFATPSGMDIQMASPANNGLMSSQHYKIL